MCLCETTLYFTAQKTFLFDILEALLVYDHVKIRYLKEKEAILYGDANDKSRESKYTTGPTSSCLQRVLRGVNWLLSPIQTDLSTWTCIHLP